MNFPPNLATSIHHSSLRLHASHRSKAGQASLNCRIQWINTGSADGRWSADGVVEFVVVPEPLVQNSMANLRIFEIKHQSKHSRYAGGCHREATRINKYKYLNIYIYIVYILYL